MKTLYFLIAFLFIANAGKSQVAGDNVNSSFAFDEITFHTEQCTGRCPDISLNIKDNKKVQLIRTVYKSNGVADTTLSGSYKGQIDQKDLDKLVALIKEINWETVTFPKQACCDRPVTTVIVSFNGRSRQYKSMEPPQATQRLVAFLTEWSVKARLPEYDAPMDFEYVPD